MLSSAILCVLRGKMLLRLVLPRFTCGPSPRNKNGGPMEHPAGHDRSAMGAGQGRRACLAHHRRRGGQVTQTVTVTERGSLRVRVMGRVMRGMTAHQAQ